MVKRQKPIAVAETPPADEVDVTPAVTVEGQDISDAYIDVDVPRDDAHRKLVKKMFGMKLDKLRLRRGWSQSELGRQAGIARGVINAYCNEKALPSPLNLQRLARALQVKPEEIIPSRAKRVDEPVIVMGPSPVDPTMVYLKIEHHLHRHEALRIVNFVNNELYSDDIGND